MAKFTVTCKIREEIEVEAIDEEEAIAIAQNIDASEFCLIDADWTAEPVDSNEG